MRSISVASLVLSVAAIVTLTAQGTNPMRPGRWQTTVQMEMAAMPMKMPPQTSARCVTAAQLERDPNYWLSQDSSCKVTDQKIVGNKVTWKVACTGQMAMTGTGEITFMGDTYEGAIKASMAQGDMTMKMSGKRLADCTQ